MALILILEAYPFKPKDHRQPLILASYRFFHLLEVTFGNADANSILL